MMRSEAGLPVLRRLLISVMCIPIATHAFCPPIRHGHAAGCGIPQRGGGRGLILAPPPAPFSSAGRPPMSSRVVTTFGDVRPVRPSATGARHVGSKVFVRAESGRGGDGMGKKEAALVDMLLSLYEDMSTGERRDLTEDKADARRPQKQRGGAEEPAILDKKKGGMQGPLMAVAFFKALLRSLGLLLFLACTFSLPVLFNAVSPSCVFICLAFHAYMWGLARMRYPDVIDETRRLGGPPGGMLGLGVVRRAWLAPYSGFMALLSLVIPWLLMLSSPDKYLPVLAPHTFVLMYQLLMESLSSAWPAPLRTYVPVFLNTYRIPLLMEWRDAVWDPSAQYNLSSTLNFTHVDKFLCAVSLAAWLANLLLFLVPTCLDAVLHPKYRNGLSPGKLEEEAMGLEALATARKRHQVAAEAVGSKRGARSVVGWAVRFLKFVSKDRGGAKRGTTSE